MQERPNMESKATEPVEEVELSIQAVQGPTAVPAAGSGEWDIASRLGRTGDVR